MASGWRAMLLLSFVLLPQLVLSGRAKKDAFDSLKEFGPSLGYRPPPPLVRRDAVSRVEYDPEKWISEPHMTISGAIMFDRETGLSVKQCLSKCARPNFQNPQSRWVCRSLTYDHKWKICDLFAISGDTPPYFLSEYRHRDYFRYLAALPPSDIEIRVNASREMSAEVQAEERKYESTTTTTASPFLKDSDTTPPPSIPFTLPEQQVVEASKTTFEESAFSPFPVIDNSFDKIESKEEPAIKAFASKQTGDSAPVIQQEVIKTEESVKKQTVEYYRKPTLKFAITPIRKVENNRASSEQSEQSSQQQIDQTTEKSTEQPTTFSSTEKSTEEPTTPFSSEAPPQPPRSTPIVRPVETPTSTEAVQTTKNSRLEIRPDGLEQVDNDDPESNKNEAFPVNRRNKVSKKIQGITTYSLQNNNANQNEGCKSGETARFIQIKKHGRVSDSAKKVDTVKVEDCVVACLNEDSFACNSAVFSSGSCSLFTDVIDHGAAYSLIKKDDSVYLERVCVPERLTSSEKYIYEAIRNYILVGQVQEVTDASTFAKCQVDCLTASENLGFVCKSAMFYPTDIESGQNCLLNSEDHESKADSFVAEDAGVNMIYFAIGDSTEHKKHRLGSSFKRLDSPIKFDDNGWTKWSKCKHDVKNSIRQRYMKCSYEKDVRKCPKQSAMCKPPSLQIKKLTKPENECRALRDSKGLRRCPHGLRVDHFGIRHYCRNPVDC